MSLCDVADAISGADHSTISTDVFDTLLLRDHSVQRERFAAACVRAAPILGVDASSLLTLRRTFHQSAYRAVAMARPTGEASLAAIDAALATALGLGPGSAEILRRTEVEVDAEHLRPNRPFLDLLEDAAAHGTRVIAVSDTYYSKDDLGHLLDAVVGPHPVVAVYASADVGLTKHSGELFDEVARREGKPPARFLHVGDNRTADVARARAASWQAVHLPRDTRHRTGKFAGKVAAMLRVLLEGG